MKSKGIRLSHYDNTFTMIVLGVLYCTPKRGPRHQEGLGGRPGGRTDDAAAAAAPWGVPRQRGPGSAPWGTPAACHGRGRGGPAGADSARGRRGPEQGGRPGCHADEGPSRRRQRRSRRGATSRGARGRSHATGGTNSGPGPWRRRGPCSTCSPPQLRIRRQGPGWGARGPPALSRGRGPGPSLCRAGGGSTSRPPPPV